MLEHSADAVCRLVRYHAGQVGRVLVYAFFKIKRQDDHRLPSVGQVVRLGDALVQGGGLLGYAVILENFLKCLVGEAELDLGGEVTAVNVVVAPVFRHRRLSR